MKIRRKVVLLIAFVSILAIGLYWGNDPENANTNFDDLQIAEVKIPSLSEKALKGVEIFNSECAVCHGVNAAGKKGIGPPLVHIIYEPGHHGDMSFLLAVQNGVRAHHWPFGNMPPIPEISERDVVSIIHYVRELQRANGIF